MRVWIHLATTVWAATAVVAQDPSAAPPKPCQAPEYRQFDFWLGEWDVANQAATTPRPPSHNRITSTQGGCVLLEEYDTPGGYTGTSLSYYDSRDGKWHQSWVDNQGAPLIQAGGVEGDRMVMYSDQPGGSRSRLTWTPLEDGSVRQHWESTQDGGATWSTVFDGLYTRRK